MGRTATVYYYVCDRCGDEWEVRIANHMPFKDRVEERRSQPQKVTFPGVHDGNGNATADSSWEVCGPCFSIIRNDGKEE